MYCTRDDVLSRWAEALSYIEAAPEKIDAAVSDASAEIDGYLVLAGVKLPLQPVPTYVVSYAADMAAYLLVLRKGFLKDADGEDEISKRNTAARKFFEKWAQGEFDAGDKDGIPPADGSGRSRVRISSGEKISLRGYW